METRPAKQLRRFGGIAVGPVLAVASLVGSAFALEAANHTVTITPVASQS